MNQRRQVGKICISALGIWDRSGYIGHSGLTGDCSPASITFPQWRGAGLSGTGNRCFVARLVRPEDRRLTSVLPGRALSGTAHCLGPRRGRL